MKTFAYVAIDPFLDLENTAFILGSIFGLNFERDVDGYYEEYPAYIARGNGLKYAILGIPNPEEDVRDTPSNEYYLRISPLKSEPGLPYTYISKKIASLINEDGRLSCRPLSDPKFRSLSES